MLRTSEFLMKDAYSFDSSLWRTECQLRQDVRGLLSDLLSMRAGLSGSRGGKRPDRRRRSTRVHGSLPTMAKTVSCFRKKQTMRRISNEPKSANPLRPQPVATKPLAKVDTPNVGSIEQVSKLLNANREIRCSRR